MITNGNDPISAIIKSEERQNFRGIDSHVNTYSDGGLTKREYFAAMALQGFLASLTLSKIPIIAKVQMSVEAADALINALNENK